MKERPILFSAPMVQAIREGRKTQTRRVVKGIPDNVTLHTYYGAYTDGRIGSAPRQAIAHSLGWFVPEAGDLWPCNDKDRLRCPYGQPGDRLWVKETYRTYKSLDVLMPSRIEAGAGIEYAAGGSSILGRETLYGTGKWRPSIFMPRKFSRILLEITRVRAERLQDISDEDLVAEGIKSLEDYHEAVEHASAIGCGTGYIPKQIYERLWDSINGAGSWDANPWVWCVSFKRIES